MGQNFLALNIEDSVRMYGLANGAGHAVMIPADMMSDPLATGGMIETACGGKGLDSGRAVEKFSGDKVCARCSKFIAGDKGTAAIDAAIQAKCAREADAVPLAELIGDHVLITMDGTREVKGPDTREESAPETREITPEEVREIVRGSKRAQVKSKRAAAIERERERLIAQREAREAAKREESASVQGSLFGRSEADMRAAVAAHYAAGHPVPAEVVSLPDPRRIAVQWSGTDTAEESVPVCEYNKGPAVEGSDADGISGKCPECRGIIGLTDKGLISAHRRYGVAAPTLPAGKRLTSKSLDAVEHGTVPGSPVDANKRRAAEALCDRSGRTVRNSTGGVKKCVGCARDVTLVKRERMVKGEVKISYVYPDHVRVCVCAEECSGSCVNDSFTRAPQGERKVTPRGTGADAGKGAREHGSVNGSANTGRVNMPPVQPKSGWLAVAGTGIMSMTVRPGVDSKVAGKTCPVCNDLVERAHANRSRGWKRAHSKKIAAWHTEQNHKRELRKVREIADGARLPQGARKAARKAASVGSFAEGTVAGRVEHDGGRPADAPAGTPVRDRARQVSKRDLAPGEAAALGKRARKAP